MVLTTEGKIMPPQLSRILKLRWCKTVRYGRQRPNRGCCSDYSASNHSVPGFQGTVGEGPEIGALQPVADDTAYGRRCPLRDLGGGIRNRLSWVASRRSSSVIGYGLR
jgi:hypothetical protein